MESIRMVEMNCIHSEAWQLQPGELLGSGALERLRALQRGVGGRAAGTAG